MARMYMNTSELYEEVKRDLVEMGIEVRPKSMQDKNVEGNPDYYTKELQNYSYVLLHSDLEDIAKGLPIDLEWCKKEFSERMDPNGNVNPGEAWKLRKEVWSEYIHDGKLAYTYNERFFRNNQLEKLVNRLDNDNDSRQIWLSVWDPNEDVDKLGGISRVPCSLGYGFQVRDGKLNMHYIMRSCDFSTHFPNDVFLANCLLHWVARYIGKEVGTFTHTIFSLHVYNKDVKGVF